MRPFTASKDVAKSLGAFTLKHPDVYYHFRLETVVVTDFESACKLVRDSSGYCPVVVVAGLDPKKNDKLQGLHSMTGSRWAWTNKAIVCTNTWSPLNRPQIYVTQDMFSKAFFVNPTIESESAPSGKGSEVPKRKSTRRASNEWMQLLARRSLC